MSMTFTKLFSSITESTVWCEPDRIRLVWITMLAMADSRGRVWASIPGLANRARVPVDDAKSAIDRFLAPDEYSRTPDNDGRRVVPIDGGWRLLNHEKYRAIRDEEAIKESKRKYINTKRAVDKAAATEVLHMSTSSTVDRSRHNAEAEAEADTKKTTKPPSPTGTPPLPDGVDPQVWSDWIALRKAKKAPVTRTVLAGAIAESVKAGMSLDAFLRIWCSRGSQGMEASWIKPDERSSGETAFQRSRRENVAAFTGGLAARRVKTNREEVIDADDVSRLG